MLDKVILHNGIREGMNVKEFMQEENEMREDVSPEGQASDAGTRANRFSPSQWGTMELILVFVIGAAIGFGAKTQAYSRITMGFDDYTLVQPKGNYVYDINALQKDVIAKRATAAVDQPVVGGSCGQ